MLQGAQLWVKHINGKGGLNGHLVKLVVYDDGADTARHRAQVQQAVERQHVIAFLMNAEVFTGAGSIDYLNAKRVPVVGVSGGEPWAYSSPMYFPQLSTGDGFARSAVPSFAQQAIPKGKTRLATLVCVEASGCDPVDNKMAEMAKQYGFEHVYRARVTVTQPDYTAECLAARNQRAEILVPILDTNSVRRVAASCARQGYHPIFGLPGTVVDHKMKDDPNLEGAIAWTNVFPYFQSGTAATDEFQKALRTYGEGIPLGMGPPTGWVAGKLLEKAGAGLPEPPTSEALLSGLWSLQNDTLGDLTLPLTFTRDQVPPLLVCWFDFTISGRTFLSPDRFKRHCL
jgi:branched-chain amino acid transport system substrate-binding protein